MDENSITAILTQRLDAAKEDLKAARVLLREHIPKSSINRSYYAIFHAVRAAVAVKGFDSSKHSGIIAFFNAEFVKTGIFEKQVSKIIDSAFRMREKSDYLDFFVASEDEARELIDKAEYVIETVEAWLSTWSEKD